MCLGQNGWKWVQKGPKNIFFRFLSNYVFLRIFGDFFRFFGLFFDFWTQKWPKMAHNGSKKSQKIFLLFFYQIFYFYKCLVIFSDFLDNFWPFFIFGAQNEPKWLKKGPKRPKPYSYLFFIKLCIFTNFWWFFQIFWTIEYQNVDLGPIRSWNHRKRIHNSRSRFFQNMGPRPSAG